MNRTRDPHQMPPSDPGLGAIRQRSAVQNVSAAADVAGKTPIHMGLICRYRRCMHTQLEPESVQTILCEENDLPAVLIVCYSVSVQVTYPFISQNITSDVNKNPTNPQL